LIGPARAGSVMKTNGQHRTRHCRWRIFL